MSDPKLPDGWFLPINGRPVDAGAKARGCLCEQCPLRGSKPVFMESHKSPYLLIGEAPGEDEEREGRPFVGSSGMELTSALRMMGKDRMSFDIDNTIACRPPKNELERTQRWVARERRRVQALNKQRPDNDQLPEPLTPEQACAPRVKDIIDRNKYKGIISLGATATKAILQTDGSIMALRGTLQAISPEPDRVIKVLPVFHPAHVLRQKRWRSVFMADLGKAIRYFEDRLQWVEPHVYTHPTAVQLEAYLFRDEALKGSTVVDIETASKNKDIGTGKPIFDPLTDVLECVGFAQEDGQMALVVPLLSVDGHSQFYPQAELAAIWKVMIRWFEDERFKKVGHNFGYYDQLVLDSTVRRMTGFPLTIRNVFDTLLAHHVISSEHPHGLGFVASVFTDAPAWKSDFKATGGDSDRERWKYNGRDVVINMRVSGPLTRATNDINANKVFHPGFRSLMEIEHEMQRVCRGLHRVGMPVDQPTRFGHELRLTEAAEKWKRAAFDELSHMGLDPWDYFPEKTKAQVDRIKKRAERAAKKGEDYEPEDITEGMFNLGSRDTISELLFEKWDLHLPDNIEERDLYTKSGDRSTGDHILRSYLSDPRVEPQQRDFIHALRMYRRQLKILGTNIIPLQEDFGFSYCKLSEHSARPEQGWSGRVHADWKAHGTLVGRLAADNPNVVNWTEDIRDMVMARPGYKLIDADQDALHLRIIASLWQIPSLQEAFLGKPRFHRGWRMGPHETFAELLFGDSFMKSPHGTWPSENSAEKWRGDAKGRRDTAKTVRYAGAYGAKVPTIFREVTATEDKKTGKLVFANMPFEEMEDMHATWMTKEPQWEQAWDKEVDQWQIQGFLADPIHGRRRYFGDMKKTDVINYRVLATEAALMNEITIDLINEIPFESLGEFTGLIQQNYDSVLLEVPESHAERIGGMVKELMTRRLPGMEVEFVGNPVIRDRWYEEKK